MIKESFEPEARPSRRAGRIHGLIIMIGATGFGLASRWTIIATWPLLGTYGGDAAWSAAACGGFRLLFPDIRSRSVATLGLLAATLVEFSQLVHIGWLDAIRATTPGALLLGRGFLWSDLAAYTAGAIAAGCLDATVSLRNDASR